MNSSKSKRIIVSLMIGATVIVFFFLSSAAFHNPEILSRDLYSYDEPDYMYAADKGFFANYFDKGVGSLATFISVGIKYGFNKSGKGRIVKYMRSSNDLAFYRHFHGPMYFYWLCFGKKLGLSTEVQMRYATLVLLLICAIAILVIINMLFPENFFWTALPIGAIFMFGPSIILTFNHCNPHTLYMVFSLISLGFMTQFYKTGRPLYWYWSLIVVSLSFMTIEYAPLLLFAQFICLIFLHKKIAAAIGKKEIVRFAVISCFCFIMPIIMLWPGGLIKFTIVKNYLVYAYVAFFRGDVYGFYPPMKIWLIRISESPVEYLLLFVGVIAMPFIIKKQRHLLPLVIYGGFVLLAAHKVTSSGPQYISSIFPPLYLLAAAAMNYFLESRKILRSVISVAVVSIIILNYSVFFSKTVHHSRQTIQPLITSLHDICDALPGKETPVFLNAHYMSTLNYYCPPAQLEHFLPKRDTMTLVLDRISSVLNERGGSAMLIVDHQDNATAELLKQRFLILGCRDLYLSDIIPHAVSYRLSINNTPIKQNKS